MKSNAIFSDDRTYRYVLERQWDEGKKMVLFIGLNPSTADETVNDPTIRRIIGFAERWGYGGVYVCNIFAFRTPYPEELFAVPNPVGELNDEIIRTYYLKSDKTVLAYGNQGNNMNRHFDMLKIIQNPYCIKISKAYMPMHPLYLKYTKKPVNFLK